MIKKLLLIQGIFYLTTGIWPVLHIDSFMWVTGSKTDIWLVKMVGLLSITISISMFSQLKQNQQPILLSISSAISFLAIDVYYVINGTISRVYLADAAIELIFLTTAGFSSVRRIKYNP